MTAPRSAAGDDSVPAAVAGVWRRESARVIAGLTRLTRDLDLAEDLAQDALLAALQQWPREGVPSNPAAWLTAVAKRRAVDQFRRADTLRRTVATLGNELQEIDESDLADTIDSIDDDVLRLLFLTCHPSIPPDGRSALTLRLVGGLSTQEIARGFLVQDSTVGQRISRAKRTLTEEGLEFELPTGAERESRLSDVLAVVYLVFTEGHTATAGRSWARADLCYEAVRLARLLADLVSGRSEVHALQALLELQASRLPARVDDRGEAVLLERQDRERWDQRLIQRGLSALARAEACANGPGQYLLQAQIAACHARASSAAATEWSRIAELYDRLEHLQPNPVVTLNRAVAHGRAYGPDSGLAILESLGEHSALARSPMLPAVRGDLFQQAGRHAEAAAAFLQAARQTRNEAERGLLLRRATEFS